MSLDLINHKLTTSTTDENGVITWSNPAVIGNINSKGEVYGKNGNKLLPQNGNRKQYGITMCALDGTSFRYTSSYNSLFSRIVLGVKLGYCKTLVKDDLEKGYTEDNMRIVNVYKGRNKVKHSNLEKYNKAVKLYKKGLTIKEVSKQVGVTTQTIYNWLDNVAKVRTATQPKSETKQPFEKKSTPKQLTLTTDTQEIEMNTTNKQYYTIYEAKNEHITEDGAVFPTKELAEWHQEKVSKGKGNAQVVLDYNGGYVLAEQIYFQEVVYNKTKPYTNFIDVLNNNQGIVSNVQEEHCKFDQLDKHSGLSPVQLKLFGLDKVINLPCTKLQAEKINTSLNKYSEAFSKLEDEHKTLKDLLNQVS